METAWQQQIGPQQIGLQQIGPYSLEHLLGRGGMGEVYKAYDERLGRWVAVKRLLQGTDEDPAAQARLRREARTLAQLGHPSIVQVFDVVEDGTGDWIVMELLEGPSLRELVDDGPLAVELALDYGRQIAAGLAAAHERGVVHRDLKAENVMALDSGAAAPGRVKIVDFGLAKWHHGLEDASTLSMSGRLLGTPRAMSPEQAAGRGADERSDLFSLGVLLYELLAGHSPFAGRSVLETLHRLTTHHPPPVRRFEPRIPQALCDLVAHLLAKDPERRPRGASRVADELARIAAEEPEGSPPPKVARTAALRSWKPPRLPNEPYPVLLPYSHPALFAGREPEISRLRRLLRSPVPVLGLCAPSGTGKSSLLAAGLVPALRQDGYPVALIRHPHEAGLATRLAGDLLEDAPTLADGDWRGFLARLEAAGQLAGAAPILVLDQLEDVLAEPLHDAPDPRAARRRAILGVLLAATVARRPGFDEPPCRWLLAYRQEVHGRLSLWLRDVLEEARALGLPGIESLPYDLSDPERFHSLPLAPLATPPRHGVALDEAARVFLAAIEKPLKLRTEGGEPRYRCRFAPGHAERLARAFAEARLARPEAPLVPALQVVLAHLLARAGDGLEIEVGDDPGKRIDEALEDHLRRALEAAFPPHAAQGRARTLLALRELATAAGQRDEGLAAEDLARVVGEGGREVLEKLANPLTRLVVPREAPEGLRYVLAHDALAEVVVRLAEEEGRRGRLFADAELLALRRLVALKTALYREAPTPDHTTATRLPRRHYRRIASCAEALLCDGERRAWWAACQKRRRVDQRRRTGLLAAAVVFLALVSWGAWTWARQRAELQTLRDQVVQGKPGAAFQALERLRSEDVPPGEPLALVRRRRVAMDVLERGLGAFGGARLAATVLRTVEMALPWVEETPDDPVLVASLVWALDFAPARDPAFAAAARELRRAVLEPLRRRRPPPPRPAPGDPDWADVPAGRFLMGRGRDERGYNDERPRHEVTVSAFRMLRHEVTHAGYRLLIPDHPGEDDLPVGSVNWYQAYTYAAWLGGRLPTEAEWEYAARAGCPYAYCTREGRRTDVDAVAWTLHNSPYPASAELNPRPVLRLEPNPWGLHDMLGNLWEWTTDVYAGYPDASRHDPWGPAQARGGARVYRGSSVHYEPAGARAANRNFYLPGRKGQDVGFRVVFPGRGAP